MPIRLHPALLRLSGMVLGLGHAPLGLRDRLGNRALGFGGGAPLGLSGRLRRGALGLGDVPVRLRAVLLRLSGVVLGLGHAPLGLRDRLGDRALGLGGGAPLGLGDPLIRLRRDALDLRGVVATLGRLCLDQFGVVVGGLGVRLGPRKRPLQARALLVGSSQGLLGAGLRNLERLRAGDPDLFELGTKTGGLRPRLGRLAPRLLERGRRARVLARDGRRHRFARVLERVLDLGDARFRLTGAVLRLDEPARGGLHLGLDLGDRLLRAGLGQRLGRLDALVGRLRAMLGYLGVALRLVGDLLVARRQARTLGGLLLGRAQLVPQVLALLAKLGHLGLQPLVRPARCPLRLDELLIPGFELRALVGDPLQLRARNLKCEAGFLELGLELLTARFELALELLDATREPLVRGLQPATRCAPVGRCAPVVLHPLLRRRQLDLDAVAVEQVGGRPGGQDVDGQGERRAPGRAVRRSRDRVARRIRERRDAVLADRCPHEQRERRHLLLGLRVPLAGDTHERRSRGCGYVFELLELELHGRHHPRTVAPGVAKRRSVE